MTVTKEDYQRALDWHRESVGDTTFLDRSDLRNFETIVAALQAQIDRPEEGWIPARWDELGAVMKFTKQDREICNRFIGCLRACGMDIMKPSTPTKEQP